MEMESPNEQENSASGAAKLIEDTHRRFQQKPIEHSLLINSVPKCGTMLLRNILLMFVPWEQVRFEFVTTEDWDSIISSADSPKVYTGHLNCTPSTTVTTRDVKHVLLFRDPRSYLLAEARFQYSDAMGRSTAFGAYVQEKNLSLDEIIPLLINGCSVNGEYREPMSMLFRKNALAWTDRAFIVRYEELLSAVENIDSIESETYFSTLLAQCGLEKAEDWKDRVIAGADRNLSGTASEKFSDADRKTLSEAEERLFLAAAPTLLEALGYAS